MVGIVECQAEIQDLILDFDPCLSLSRGIRWTYFILQKSGFLEASWPTLFKIKVQSAPFSHSGQIIYKWLLLFPVSTRNSALLLLTLFQSSGFKGNFRFTQGKFTTPAINFFTQYAMSHTPKLWHFQRCTSFTNALLRHLLNFYHDAHRNEVNFYVKCNVQNCELPITKYNSFHKRVQSHHKELHNPKYVDLMASQCDIQEEEQPLRNREN